MSGNSAEFSSITDADTAADFVGCQELRLFMNRRNMLGMSVGLFTWALMPRVASASGAADPRLLIVLLRGGMDGLNVVANTSDSNYASLRGSLAFNASNSSDVNLTGYGGYRISNLMPRFREMLDLGEAKVVLPIAPPLRTRSHFDCSFNLENGHGAGSISHDGWLNRVLARMRSSATALQPSRWSAVAIGNTPVILVGGEPVLTWSPTFFARDFFANQPLRPAGDDPLSALYRASGHAELARTLKSGLDTDLLARGDRSLFSGLNAMESAFVGAACLLRNTQGPRIGVITVDNFDSHIGLADPTKQVLGRFDSALGRFKGVMGDAWSNTVVLCVTEFGRTVTENGSGGSDHGTGTTALLAGGALNGASGTQQTGNLTGEMMTRATNAKRKIIGEWPTLARSNLLDNNDIPAVYDTRMLFRQFSRSILTFLKPSSTMCSGIQAGPRSPEGHS